MTDLYSLPKQAQIAGKKYDLNTDFRVILKIFRAFEDESLPEILRWQVALRLFYRQEIAPQDRQAAMEYLAQFLACGQETGSGSGKPLLHWDRDGDAIIAGVNAAAGCEVRNLENVHWWTFLSWFHAMPPGQLSTRVSIRQKLQKGQKLDPWEQEFYRENKAAVDGKSPLSPEEQAQKQRLNARLGK